MARNHTHRNVPCLEGLEDRVVPAILGTLDFESGQGVGYTTSVAEFSDNGFDFFTHVPGKSVGSTFTVNNPQGSAYFAVQDTDGEGGPASGLTLTLTAIDITAATNLSFSVLIAEDDASDALEDWDADTSVRIEYSIDGSAFQNGIAIEAVGGTNTAPRIDTTFDGIGDGAEITPDFTQYSANISGTGSSLVLRVTFDELEEGDEDIALDNFVIEGDVNGNPSAIVDLNGADGTGLDFANTFMTSAVNITDTDATVTDNDTQASLSLTVTGVQDGAGEVLSFGQGTPTNVPLNADLTTTASAGGTTFQISYTQSTGLFTITNNVGGDMPVADVQALVRSIVYNNVASLPTIGDRTIEFVANDGTSNSNPATSTITVEGNIDLEVTKSVSDELTEFNDTITYTVTVTNTGNETATGVQLRDLVVDAFGTPTNVTPSEGTVTVGTPLSVVASTNAEIRANGAPSTDTQGNTSGIIQSGGTTDPMLFNIEGSGSGVFRTFTVADFIVVASPTVTGLANVSVILEEDPSGIAVAGDIEVYLATDEDPNLIDVNANPAVGTPSYQGTNNSFAAIDPAFAAILDGTPLGTATFTPTGVAGNQTIVNLTLEGTGVGTEFGEFLATVQA